MKVNVFGSEYDLVFQIEQYSNNGTLAVLLVDAADGENFAVLSVNIPDPPELGPKEFFAKVWSENQEVANQLRPHFEVIGKVPLGFVEAEHWKFKDDLSIYGLSEEDFSEIDEESAQSAE